MHFFGQQCGISIQQVNGVKVDVIYTVTDMATDNTMSTDPTPHYLSTRDPWQSPALAGGSKLEDTVHVTLSAHVTAKSMDCTVIKHPTILDQLFIEEDYRTDPASVSPEYRRDPVTGVFYNQNGTRAKHGRIPDIGIRNNHTGKMYLIECKNQKDAGNAHERAATYATPGIIASIQRKLGVDYHPVGYLFSGPMVTNRKYIGELRCTYSATPDHLLLWAPERPAALLTDWFDRVISPLLM